MFKDNEGILHIHGKDLTILMNDKDIKLIDIREQYEINICSVPGSLKIPMYTLLRGFEQLLNKDDEYYILCHTGQRSYYVTDILTQKGYKVINVVGGIVSIDEHNVPY